MTDTLPKLRARVRKILEQRCAPDAIKAEVDKLVDAALKESVEFVVTAAFGFVRDWTGEYKFRDHLRNGPLTKQIDAMLLTPEVEKFIKDSVGDFKTLIKPKTLTEWRRAYRDMAFEAYERRAEELVTEHATSAATARAESDFHRMLKEIVDKEENA